MWLVLALSTALVTLFAVRNVMQAAAIGRYLEQMGPFPSEVAGVTASSAGWIVDTAFVVATAWAVIAVCAFSGSRIGRAIFTVVLVASALYGLWNTVDPQATALALGELILAAAHPPFMSLTSLSIAVISIVILALLYRPQVSAYFDATSPARDGCSRHYDNRAGSSAPHLMAPGVDFAAVQ